ncbi:MAG: hypothetical protein KDE58_13040, partial [Caldilineaceae bacterium]|nr:hypothetical protein [Caldilineaceae bacterium]
MLRGSIRIMRYDDSVYRRFNKFAMLFQASNSALKIHNPASLTEMHRKMTTNSKLGAALMLPC